MHGKRTKKKSKRVTLSHKYKIQKKVREHHRKLRKEMKKNPGKFKKRKDPGIPNSLPFKAEVVKELKELKEYEDERKKILNQELKLRRKEERDNLFDSNRNIGEFLENINERVKDFESAKKVISEEHNLNFTDKSAKAFYKEFKKVVEAADVILEVLDARDPQGTRCSSMEELVRNASNKRLVLILNKADLVPKNNLEKWLKYLRREYPTVLFKASTQNQARNLSQAKTKALKKKNKMQVSQCIGADLVMQLLKNYCRNAGIKTAITVGVVGLPNVGKSSVINSLKRSKACNVGAVPGITKKLQEVSLDSKVRLIDTPGVILPGKDSSDESSTLRNAFRVDSLKDPVPAFQAIFDKAGKDYMMLQYGVSGFDDAMEFLSLYAKKTGKLRNGGKPQTNVVAKMILQDWNTGKIKYYTSPPETCADSNSAIVAQMSEEFSLEKCVATEKQDLGRLPGVNPNEAFLTTALAPVDEVEENEMEEEKEEEEKMEEDGAAEAKLNEEKAAKQNGNSILPKNIELEKVEEKMSEEVAAEKIPRWETVHKKVEITTSTRLKKMQKAAKKKQRKEKTRNERRMDSLAEAMEAFDGVSTVADEEYDFKDYFNK